ncbi:MAG: mechanosensitive ion channel [Clostridia bacterium]|nr:mechanosensitive ion channel [Clostridia bacterium]
MLLDTANTTGNDILQTIQNVNLDNINQDVSKLWEAAIPLAKSIASAILLFIVGLIAIRIIRKALRKAFDKNQKLDKTVKTFTLSSIDIALKIVLLLSVVATLGVEITSIIAIFGAASFAVGLALQGSLENFAGGVMLLIFKPFKVGDFIEVGEYKGTVHSMTIIATKLDTLDNKRIIIPNSKTSSSTLINYSTNERRRVEITIGVDYESDIQKVRSVIMDVINSNERIYSDPAPIVGVVELADSSINFTVKVWVDKEIYYETLIYLNEEIKMALDKNEIEIPYPHVTIVNK